MQINLEPIFSATRIASLGLAKTDYAKRQKLLHQIAEALVRDSKQIYEINEKDLAVLPKDDPKWDRLLLNPSRIHQLAESLYKVAELPDPTATVYLEKTLSNGLKLKKIAVPLGVVGVIYEARPNVTIDVSALCLMSGNAVLLKGSREAFHTNQALTNLVQSVLVKNNLGKELVTLLPPERELMTQLLQATKYVDVIIPRGSDSLIQYVRQNSLVPTIETGAGVVHTYIHNEADLEKAVKIVVNAKTTRPVVCNSLDCVLVDRSVAESFIKKLSTAIKPFEVNIHADKISFEYFKAENYPNLFAAEETDFGKEWLSLHLSFKTVSHLQEALGI